jgi:nitroreductase
MNEIFKVMEERSSVRLYQKNKEIPNETLYKILEMAGKAPSAWNLQHWRFLVVTAKEQKEKLFPIAYNQKHVLDASAVVIILGDTEADKVAPEVFEKAPEEARNLLLKNINSAYSQGRPLGEKEALKNASLGAMQLMLAAKALGIDSCPMSGFDHEAIIPAFGIPERFIPVMMITLGYADGPAKPTDRFDVKRLVMHEKFEDNF